MAYNDEFHWPIASKSNFRITHQFLHLVRKRKAMTDVRALLRSERAARKITHPHAFYSPSGTLACRVCRLQIKAESQWEAHLRSKQHISAYNNNRENKNAQQAGARPAASENSNAREQGSDASVAMATTGNARKRKADSVERGDEEEKEDGLRGGEREGLKVQKLSRLPQRFVDEGEKEKWNRDGQEEVVVEEERGRVVDVDESTKGMDKAIIYTSILEQHQTLLYYILLNPFTNVNLPDVSTTQQPGSPVTQPSNQAIDEDEWAAFERDVAVLPLDTSHATGYQNSVSALESAATIQAAPLTAEEIAAQAREEQSRQRETKETEMEEEKEDATRKLEEELDELEELELRVKRLKERREAIRRVNGVKGNEAISTRRGGGGSGDSDGDGDVQEDGGEVSANVEGKVAADKGNGKIIDEAHRNENNDDDDNDDDEDMDEDDDGWDAWRLR